MSILAKRICSKCKSKHATFSENKKCCDRCLEKAKPIRKLQYAKRKAQSLCTRCGKPKGDVMGVFCKNCRIENNERKRKYRNEIERPYRAVIDTSKCHYCEFAYHIHVHHIDGDSANNDASNLIALCPNHHALAHLGMLKISQHLPNALIWGK